MKYILLIINLFCVHLIFSQQITIKDRNTQKPIPFAAIIFGNDNGFYANADGLFQLSEVEGDSLSISSMGYQLKKMAKKDIKEAVIFLDTNNFELEEVVITTKPLKYKYLKFKPKKHNDFSQGHRLIIGEELAVFIPNNYSQHDYIEIRNLTIPIVTKTISYDKELLGKAQRVKKLPFSSLYKISFYTNNEGIPDKKLDYDDIVIVLNEKSTAITVDLSKHDIALPAEGIFVGILNLGKTDELGQLISETPFEIKKTKTGLVKVAKPTNPHFPVYYSEKTNLTYSRVTLIENKEWQIFYKHGVKQNNEFHNIGLGFELKYFED